MITGCVLNRHNSLYWHTHAVYLQPILMLPSITWTSKFWIQYYLVIWISAAYHRLLRGTSLLTGPTHITHAGRHMPRVLVCVAGAWGPSWSTLHADFGPHAQCAWGPKHVGPRGVLSRQPVNRGYTGWKSGRWQRTTGRIRCPVVLVFSSGNSDFHLKFEIWKIIQESFTIRLFERVFDLEMA